MSESDPRELAIAELSRGFADDRLSMEEFERRVAAVYAAKSPGEVSALIADLRAPAAVLGGSGVPSALTSPATRVGALLGSTERRGPITVPAQMVVRSIFGSVELDLRDAQYVSPTVEMDVRATFGSVEIIVPPGVRVDWEGSAIFGSVEQIDDAPFSAPTRVLIRLTGRVLFGSVEVRTQLPSP